MEKDCTSPKLTDWNCLGSWMELISSRRLGTAVYMVQEVLGIRRKELKKRYKEILKIN
jgi:hypothetical protein